MPDTLSYPGVYIEEVPSGVRTIVGASTSTFAVADFFRSGPLDEPSLVTSFADFERRYGGLDSRSEGSYALWQYFLNGGNVAYVVRVASGAAASDRTLPMDAYHGSRPTLRVAAANPGVWGNHLQVATDVLTRDPARQFNLAVQDVRLVNGRRQVVASETFRNLDMDATSTRFAPAAVNRASALIRLFTTDVDGNPLAGHGVPGPTGGDVITNPQPGDFLALGSDGGTAGSDGVEPTSDTWRNSAGPEALLGKESERTGIFALESIAPRLFNVLCLPGSANFSDQSYRAVVAKATEYCGRKRAFLIMDIPEDVASVASMEGWLADHDGLRDANTAVYFPRLLIPDPLNDNRPRNVASSGTLAGVYARTDANRGVWKAPAGTDAVLRGADIAVKMNDLENGLLNPLGVNCLRTFPVYGPVSWGARTLEGADQIASEWKYLPVRRTALFIEESLYEGLTWVVFEPNDEPLWAQIRQNVGAFLQDLFRQGAFQGSTPRQAYFVRCGSDTTTPTDQDRGIVNILVGFAPLKPAEFVVVKIQQIAGQASG